MKNGIPEVSVCIPVYNNERYVGAAIESVLSQTYTDFELLLINDYSSDRSLEVIRAYQDPRIRIIENDRNLGAGGNWNKALSEASGKFIKILCGDDLLHPTCIEEQLAALKDPANSGVVMACCARDIVISSGRKIITRSFAAATGRLGGVEAVRRNVRSGTNRIGEPSAVLFRADLVPLVEGFREEMRYVIDLDFWCRLLLHGDLYVMPKALCSFRVSVSAWSFRVAQSQSGDFCHLLEYLQEDRRFSLARKDCLVGKLRSRVNMYLRRCLYLVLPGDQANPGSGRPTHFQRTRDL